jgi:hypothetical protein
VPQLNLPAPPATERVHFGEAMGVGIDGEDIDGDGTLDVWYTGGHLRANYQENAWLEYDPSWTPANVRDGCEARGPAPGSQGTRQVDLSALGARDLICASTSRPQRVVIFLARKDTNAIWINVGSW